MFSLFFKSNFSKIKVFLLLLTIALQVIGTLYIPTLTASIINNGIFVINLETGELGDLDYVFRTGMIMLGVAFLTGVASILRSYLSASVATSFSRTTRKRLFAKTQELSVEDFKKFETSSLITRATNDIEQVQMIIIMFFEMLIPVPFVAIIGTILAFRIDYQMSIIILSIIGIFIAVVTLISVILMPLFGKVQKSLDNINSKVGQYISGIRVIRAFNRTKLEQENMDKSFNNLARINIKINRIFAVVMPVIMITLNLAMVAILYFGTFRIDSGHMEIGDITAVIQYAMNILMFLIMGVFTVIFIPRAAVSAKRIKEILNHNPQIKDDNIKFDKLNDKDICLEFKDVTFGYTDAEKPVLQNLTFTANMGQTIAIIGGTGSGKSTVAKLIPRLHDVKSGKILINKIDIKELPQKEVRKVVGFVPQKSFLFSGTIADNLRHGNKDATEEDMDYAIKIAQAEKFINEYEEKYEKKVSQSGKNFSGGQKQRLSIARMLMKKPSIYVFDDSFSALDYATDASLRKALKEITKEAIVINVAQRISTIRDADLIIVLEEGKIVGKGTHKELMKSCEVYIQTAKSQLSEEELV